MKKTLILMLILISTIFISCTSIAMKNNNGRGKEVLNALKDAYPDDNFSFIYGITKERSIATNIRYRGIIYSDRLKELNYPKGLEVAFERLPPNEARLSNVVKAYEAMFWQVEIDNMVEKKAIKLFGEKCNLINDWSMNLWKYRHVKGNIAKENVSYDDKNGAYATIVNVFVNDLKTLDIEEYKQKTFELSKYIYNYMNYVTSLQIYVRDNSYFENYDLVVSSVYKPFRARADIKAILNKMENKEKLSEMEEITLVKSFRKGGLDYDNTKFIKFDYFIYEIEKIEDLTYEKTLNTKIINRKGRR